MKPLLFLVLSSLSFTVFADTFTFSGHPLQIKWEVAESESGSTVVEPVAYYGRYRCINCSIPVLIEEKSPSNKRQELLDNLPVDVKHPKYLVFIMNDPYSKNILWEMIVAKKGESISIYYRDYKPSISIYSQVIGVDIDCKKARTRDIQFSNYDDYFAKGSVINSQNVEEDWSKIIPGTLGEKMYLHRCSKP